VPDLPYGVFEVPLGLAFGEWNSPRLGEKLFLKSHSLAHQKKFDFLQVVEQKGYIKKMQRVSLNPAIEVTNTQLKWF